MKMKQIKINLIYETQNAKKFFYLKKILNVLIMTSNFQKKKFTVFPMHPTEISKEIPCHYLINSIPKNIWIVFTNVNLLK